MLIPFPTALDNLEGGAAFFDLDGFDISKYLILALGLELDGRRVFKLEKVAGGGSAWGAEQNRLGHEFKQTREAG